MDDTDKFIIFSFPGPQSIGPIGSIGSFAPKTVGPQTFDPQSTGPEFKEDKNGNYEDREDDEDCAGNDDDEDSEDSQLVDLALLSSMMTQT